MRTFRMRERWFIHRHDFQAWNVFVKLRLDLSCGSNEIVAERRMRPILSREESTMPSSDPAMILVTHDRWATEQLLDSCRQLTHEQFHQPFEMGPGSIHNTINHMLGAIKGWSDLLAGREQEPRLEKTDRTIDELTQLHAELADEFQRLAADHPHDEVVTGARGGREYSFTRGGVLTHVTTHSMHHRAQCLNMLRQLGVEQLPASAVVEWILTVDNVTEE